MSGLLIYTAVAMSIALTSYINIYKPAINLYIEITEDEDAIFNSFIMKSVWILFATVVAPYVAFILLRGNNTQYSRDLVIIWLGSDDDE